MAPGDGGREGDGVLRLTEPDARQRDPGGDAHAAAGSSGGDWVLTGTKMWITNGSIAGLRHMM